jgi:hypothetical protein
VRHRIAFVCLCAAAASLVGARSGLAEELLRGPYPFRKDNALALWGGYGVGPGDTPSGPRARLEYGFMIDGSLWLGLELGLLTSPCSPPAPAPSCGAQSGNLAEVMGGLVYKLQMDIPGVPYAKALAGPIYLFPDDAANALGFGVRAGLGFKYFLFEWLGLGAELGGLLGYAAIEEAAGVSSAVRTIDFLLGAEVAF